MELTVLVSTLEAKEVLAEHIRQGESTASRPTRWGDMRTVGGQFGRLFSVEEIDRAGWAFAQVRNSALGITVLEDGSWRVEVRGKRASVFQNMLPAGTSAFVADVEVLEYKTSFPPLGWSEDLHEWVQLRLEEIDPQAEAAARLAAFEAAATAVAAGRPEMEVKVAISRAIMGA
jgi:hypothetical protein